MPTDPMSPSPSTVPKSQTLGVIIALVVLCAVGFLVLYFKADMDGKQLSQEHVILNAQIGRIDTNVTKLTANATTIPPVTNKPENQPVATTPIEWLPYDSWTLKLSYPKGFYIKSPPELDGMTLESYAGELRLTGGIGCEVWEACSQTGLGLRFEDIHTTKLPIADSDLISTANPNVKQQKTIEAATEGPSYPPKARYYYIGKKTIYVIEERDNQFNGDTQKVIDGVIASLHE